jgi:type IV pilus assembly protein PilY1
VYAGDLQGNLWRFDLTSNNVTNWAVTPGPLFKTPGGQPITTAIVAASGAPSASMQQQLMLLFGTGQKTPLTSTSPATYATGTQSLYGVWDWNLTNWNTIETGVTYAAMTAANTGIGGANATMTISNLQQQTVTVNATTLNRDIASNASVCWAVLSTCASNKQFGWYLNLPGVQEQIIFNPELVAQALTVNSIVPAPNSPTSCASVSDTGFTYVLSAMTGGAFNEVFLPPVEQTNSTYNTNPQLTDTTAIGMQTNATGTSFITSNGAGQQFLVFETNQTQTGTGANGNNLQGGVVGPNLPPNTTGRRTSWIERR